MGKILEKAYAKINLGLDILGKRDDGYHQVRMVMQSIGLHDTVELEEGEGLQTKVSGCSLPTGPENLVWQAATLLANECDKNPNVHIKLNKKIFLAAGLAGGSSDAAAVLRGLNRLWQLKLSAQELEELAAKLGSDVPFCISGGTALAEGRGEVLTQLPEAPILHLVLAKPKVEVSTAWVYKNFNQDMVKNRPNIDEIIKALTESDMSKLLANCGNVLEAVTISAHSIIAQIKKRMLEQGAIYSLMSGSGPTVFGIANSEECAQQVLKSLENLNLETKVTTTVKRSEF